MPADQSYHFHAPLPTSRLSLVNSAELIYRNLFCTDCQSSTLVASRACSHFGHIIDSHQVICEKVEKSDISDIDKKKYLVPADLTVGQFVYVIRKRIKLAPEKAIFIFVDEILPPTAALMSTIYEEHKDEDGFLYVSYSGENTFGKGLRVVLGDA
ncbi:hypothetical protein FFLO_04346 [Filobasidium floriforme]|uniref:Autophagy-related protein n=1 Tax=Filobasidium floriforme TaxID=5210 RepID=A0A8K0NSC0_9TREE|nr:hypothetical protein FFLO_04346 [Filobasidium floriforme]